MCQAPARLVGLDRRKGALRRGFDADLILWDPDRELAVDGAALQHRSPLTPYHGERLFGVVRTTVLGGRVIYDAARGGHQGRPGGRMLRRG